MADHYSRRWRRYIGIVSLDMVLRGGRGVEGGVVVLLELGFGLGKWEEGRDRGQVRLDCTVLYIQGRCLFYG